MILDILNKSVNVFYTIVYEYTYDLEITIMIQPRFQYRQNGNESYRSRLDCLCIQIHVSSQILLYDYKFEQDFSRIC